MIEGAACHKYRCYYLNIESKHKHHNRKKEATMSMLISYIKKEQLVKQLEGELIAMKESTEIQKDLEFKEKLEALIFEYGVDKEFVLKVVDPEAYSEDGKPKKTRKPRKLKIYKNPHTGEVVETKGMNHRVLKLWKKEYGGDTVESWVVNDTKAVAPEVAPAPEEPKQEAKKEVSKKPTAKREAKRELPISMKPKPKGHKPKFQFTPSAKASR